MRLYRFLFLGCLGSAFMMPVLADSLRDPTQPLVGGQTIQEERPVPILWELTAILISPTRRLATVNGEMVKVGDRIGNQKVIAIEANTVQLAGPDGKMTLFLIDPAIKHTVKGS